MFRYRSTYHWVETVRTFYGPVANAFAALDEAGASAFWRDLHELAESANTAVDGTARILSEYVEAVVVGG